MMVKSRLAYSMPFGNSGLLKVLRLGAAAAIAAGALAGCAPLLVGGAVVGTSMVASDRRTTGAQLEDEVIDVKATNRAREVLGGRGSVGVTSYNRLVLVTGEVPSEADKAAVGAAVKGVENVQTVVNEVAVGPNLSLSARSNDVLITSKVKASFVDAKDLFARSIKVVVANGVVYLMGRVTEREANRATEIARGVGGVKKVVKVFDIISESELAGTQPKAPVRP